MNLQFFLQKRRSIKSAELQAAAAQTEILAFSADFSMKIKPSP
jgi:hypothetical protein